MEMERNLQNAHKILRDGFQFILVSCKYLVLTDYLVFKDYCILKGFHDKLTELPTLLEF